MRLDEFVNPDVFRRGFEKTKPILNGEYTLVAKHGELPYSQVKKINVSDQFRIEAKQGNAIVGWVNFKISNNKLEAIDLVVDPKHRRKGIATEMYKFAKELGNEIVPSGMQTPMGKAFWSGAKHESK